MARNRQRAKERQARRKAQGADGGLGRQGPDAPPKDAPAPDSDPQQLSASEAIRSGAPPEDTGFSAHTLEYEQDVDSEEGEEHFDPVEDQPEGDDGVPERIADRDDGKNRPRLVQFLVAVWAELQRVQWPDRQALITLTGVVLGFVLIAGGYLGLLDAIFSRVIQELL